MENLLEQLFVQIINMSITASYVILAVLLMRLLLKRAPKKYSYALWSVVAFRLCCPVSFQSIFSLFSLKLFDMSKAQSESGAALQYVPENIGMMAQPEVTVGIPYANAAINGSLPAATPMYSANPMQIWTAIGAYLWGSGVAVLLFYSVVSCILLHYRMRNAILLESNVRQSDKVSSPFMLGIFRPRIYIPFGLDPQSLEYVLTHERYHLKRKDHIIKLLAFLLLTMHWFNPLCWLGFTLMSRDMEMSCDEKVLSGSETSKKSYSTTLLAFASNRRFPTPSPLAFGETGVKKRIKNVLNWKKPALWITVPAVLICGIVLIACAANPVAEDSEEDLFTTYVSTDCIYISMLSSYFPMNGDSGYYYLMNDDSFYIAAKSNGEIVAGTSLIDWEWQPFPYTAEEWRELFEVGADGDLRLTAYEEQLYLDLAGGYSLLKMDEELWIMRTGQHPNGDKFAWDIYKIESSGEKEGITAQQPMDADPLETAIHNAILDNCKSPYIVSGLACESHVIIGTLEYERYSEELSQTAESVDVYTMVLFQELSYKKDGLETVLGSHGPAVLSFDKGEQGEYILTNFWRPRDGSDYKPDIEQRFGQLSQEAVDNALDTRKYIMAQKQRCYAQAVEYFEMDVDAVIEGLLEDLVSFPPWAAAPAPQDPIERADISGDIAYRELLYYGDYTLQYISEKLTVEMQTDLKGQCMAILKQELEELKQKEM